MKRNLIVLATGTGKTFVAFQIVWKLLQSGAVKRVLYLADRNFLIDQTIQQDFSPLQVRLNFVSDLVRLLEPFYL